MSSRGRRLIAFAIFLPACTLIFAPLDELGHGVGGDGDIGGDGDGDSDTDIDVDSDTDSDTDADGDADGAFDADADPDADRDDEAECRPLCDGRECGADGCGGECPPGCADRELCSDEGRCEISDCALNAGWGAACEDTNFCDDGTTCVTITHLPGHRGICTPECDGDCPDISTGEEVCDLEGGESDFCSIDCHGEQDCPCDLACVPWSEDVGVCYPEH